jgi:hypothetical protein
MTEKQSFEPVPKPEGFEDTEAVNDTPAAKVSTSLGNKVKKRPTETATGLGLLAAVYGFLTQAGVANEIAALVSVVVAFIPVVSSNLVDRYLK